MRCVALALVVAMGIACSGRDEAPIVVDAASPDSAVPDAALPDAPSGPDAAPAELDAPILELRAGAACDSDDRCAGGTCLGRSGGIEPTNPRFSGGYCTALQCVPESQDGCGPDEWCIDGGSIS